MKNDYRSWNRSIKIVLGAEVKLGFINGKCMKPSEDLVEYD